MKILILSDINSPHTQKWAIALAQRGMQIGIFSMSQPTQDWYSIHNILLLNSSSINKNKFESNSLSKTSYLKLLPQLKKTISEFGPQIVHAHYASSYGFLGALSGFHPYLISAWGSDVMDFPNNNLLNRKILKYNFKKADHLFATSDVLIKAISKYSKKIVSKISFGIDSPYFKPVKIEHTFPKETVVIGTIKSLEEIYGIDILIKAFKKVVENDNNVLLKLMIVGGGSKESELKTLANRLNIGNKVVFIGKVEYSEVVKYHNMIDIFVNVSRNESFGVAVLEASSCEKPVIVSNIGGLTEVVLNGETGLFVEPEDVNSTADAINLLVSDETLRKKMGVNGRKFVQKHFEFETNVKDTIAIYQQIIAKE